MLAPLAGGPSTPELAAAASAAGALGFVAAGYLSPDELAARLRRTRALTGAPVGVNLFVLREEPVFAEALLAYGDELAAEAARFGVELGSPRFDDDAYEAKVEVIAAWAPEVVSFAFGIPEDLGPFRSAGCEVWATATTVADAQVAAARGVDVVVAQGAEAGGHRGGLRDDADDLPLLELVRTIRAAVDVPVVAAGGCGRPEDVLAALDAGAFAVQCGTAFLLCPEAGTSPSHRRALQAPGETAITRAFTGRRARGIVNAFMRDHPHAPAAYPHVHNLTAPLRAAARAADDADRMNLWAGERFSAARAEPAADVVARLSV